MKSASWPVPRVKGGDRRQGANPWRRPGPLAGRRPDRPASLGRHLRPSRRLVVTRSDWSWRRVSALAETPHSNLALFEVAARDVGDADGWVSRRVGGSGEPGSLVGTASVDPSGVPWPGPLFR